MTIRYVLYPIIDTSNNYLSINLALKDCINGDIIKIYNGKLESLLTIHVYIDTSPNGIIFLSFNTCDLIIITNIIKELTCSGYFIINNVNYKLIAINGGTTFDYDNNTYTTNNMIISGNNMIIGDNNVSGNMTVQGNLNINGTLTVNGIDFSSLLNRISNLENNI
jgi:hypothetical protein